MKPVSVRLAEAKAMKATGNDGAEAACQLLIALAQEFPDDAEVQTEAAFIHDALGYETQAIPYYEHAIQLGLAGVEDKAAVYLGLGSSYRTIGRYQDARVILEAGCGLFPQNRAMPVFLAMAYYNLGQHAAAMEKLLITIAETSSNTEIKHYSRAIAYYADKLDQTWT